VLKLRAVIVTAATG